MTERLSARHVTLQGSRFVCKRNDALIARVIQRKEWLFQHTPQVRERTERTDRRAA